MITVLNDPADGARTRSGSDQAGRDWSVQRCTCRRLHSSRTGTTRTRSASRLPARRPFATAARGGSCLRGQLHVLHPDETHDGAPATEGGFGYRIIYIAPELIRGALAGRALPFVADPVQELTPATRTIASLLADIDEPVSELSCAEIAIRVADGLLSLIGRPETHPRTIDTRAVEVVREYLSAHAREQTLASTLEEIASIDRFTIARHFRLAFGTSPDRYRTMRRLALARAAIESGHSLARVAAETGFADQSHMTRQFKRAYGLTPARWVALIAETSLHPFPREKRTATTPRE